MVNFDSVSTTRTSTYVTNLTNSSENSNAQSIIQSCNSLDNSKNVLHLNCRSLICKWYNSRIPKNTTQIVINNV